jgi:hypothetical protein
MCSFAGRARRTSCGSFDLDSRLRPPYVTNGDCPGSIGAC